MFFNFTILSFGIEILEFYRRDDRNEYAFDGFLTSERFVIEPLPFVRPKKSTWLGFFNIITRVYCLGRVASPLTTLPDAFESGEMSPVYTQTTEIPGSSRKNAVSTKSRQRAYCTHPSSVDKAGLSVSESDSVHFFFFWKCHVV